MLPLHYTNRLVGQQETKLIQILIRLFSSSVLLYVGKQLTFKSITKPGVDGVLAQQHLNLAQNMHPRRSTSLRQCTLHRTDQTSNQTLNQQPTLQVLWYTSVKNTKYLAKLRGHDILGWSQLWISIFPRSEFILYFWTSCFSSVLGYRSVCELTFT